MNKLTYLLFAAAPLLGACSNDDNPITPDKESVKATFHLNMPADFATRAGLLGQANKATNMRVLLYNVNESETPVLVSDNEYKFADDEMNKNIDLDLVTNNSYQVVFFVASPSAMPFNEEDGDINKPVYSISDSEGLLTVNYSNMNSDDNVLDCYDCFYGSYKTGTVGSTDINATITLTRPMAQVNWGNVGTLDTETFGQNGKYISTSFVAHVPQILNLLTGEPELEQNQLQYILWNFGVSPSTQEATYPVNGVTYVALQYILAPVTEPMNVYLTLSISNQGNGNYTGSFKKTITVQNAPLQANYQTNIYGDLLTPETDTDAKVELQ